MLRPVAPGLRDPPIAASSLKREFSYSHRGVLQPLDDDSYKGCRDIGRRLRLIAALGLCSSARAMDATSTPSSTLQEILVIGTSRFPGGNIDHRQGSGTSKAYRRRAFPRTDGQSDRSARRPLGSVSISGQSGGSFPARCPVPRLWRPRPAGNFARSGGVPKRVSAS